MKARHRLFCALGTAIMIGGCAGQTTDPRQGGLFSYNPDAYEQRLQDRRGQLSAEEQASRSTQAQSASLEAEKTSRTAEKAALEKQVKQLSASLASLEKKIKAKQTTTAVQDTERQRILAELGSVRSSTRIADEMEDPEEKRLELERLKARRDTLEKEAANLMRL
jgi:chromosome segregation ATPase